MLRLDPSSDIGMLAFAAYEINEIKDTVDEGNELNDQGDKSFAVCVMGCARQWNAFDEAYDFWEIYGRHPKPGIKKSSP